VRLNKYIAACGVCSRRGADALIASGRVSVNGAAVNTMGPDIDETNDAVCLDGKPLRLENRKVYIMLNKPAGYLSTCRDDRGRKTVLSLVSGAGARIFPVGRLDMDTEGLLLLTNDGDFAYRCTHPSHEVTKEYFAVVSGPLSDAALDLLRSGVMLDGEKTRPARVELIRRTPNETHFSITIHEGKNRQVRRMIEFAGASVRYLKRISEGSLALGGLKTGVWRKLTEDEVNRLNNL
jgi:pseudouridine synthase